MYLGAPGTEKVRNVVLVGHGGAGKTSLAEAMLYLSGAAKRLGTVDDGHSALDYDPEEIKRQFSINLSLAPVVHDGVKINVIDTPGYADFTTPIDGLYQCSSATHGGGGVTGIPALLQKNGATTNVRLTTFGNV